MKGVLLAGGTGTRLRPITYVTNKHLLPVFDQPLVFYPLRTLASMGVKDVMLVSGREHAGDFLNLLGSGKDFGVRLTYEVQEEAGGIAQAVGLARDFISNEPFVVILGDNVFEDSFADAVRDFGIHARGAKIFLKEVPDAERFGVAEVRGDRVLGIEEKPKTPKSRYAVTGLYLYDQRAFEIIDGLRPSGRGELEITDVNNAYITAGEMTYEIVRGYWTDAGTFPSLFRATLFAAAKAGIRPADVLQGHQVPTAHPRGRSHS